MPDPTPKISPEQKAWYDGLPEEARKAAERAELDKNLPVLASIMSEVGVAGLCAWAAYLDVMESGNCDPYDMAEIVGAAVPTLTRAIRSSVLEEVREALEARKREVEFDLRGAELAGEDASDLHATVNGLRIALETLTSLASEGGER